MDDEAINGDEPDALDEAFRVQGDRGFCHHEAGHAVAIWQLGAKAGAVDVIADGRFGGRALYSIEGCRGVTVASLVIAAAGPIASRMWNRSAPDGGEQDRVDIERGLRALCRSTEAADIIRLHVQAEARRIIQANWDAVERIAEALCARAVLTGDDLAAVLADVEIDRANAAEPARRQHWKAIVEKQNAA